MGKYERHCVFVVVVVVFSPGEGSMLLNRSHNRNKTIHALPWLAFGSLLYGDAGLFVKVLYVEQTKRQRLQ